MSALDAKPTDPWVSIVTSTAVGDTRAWLWATYVCGGYNPCDRTFWSVLGNNKGGLSDAGWSVIVQHLVDRFGEHVAVPANYVGDSSLTPEGES